MAREQYDTNTKELCEKVFFDTVERNHATEELFGRWFNERVRIELLRKKSIYVVQFIVFYIARMNTCDDKTAKIIEDFERKYGFVYASRHLYQLKDEFLNKYRSLKRGKK